MEWAYLYIRDVGRPSITYYCPLHIVENWKRNHPESVVIDLPSLLVARVPEDVGYCIFWKVQP